MDLAYRVARSQDNAFRDAINEASKAERRNPETWARVVLRNIKHRAKQKGLDFSLEPHHLSLPAVCPVLGIPIVIGGGLTGPASPNSPSVDRLDNSKGYTPDNVRVISNRANLLKKDATRAEIRALLAYMDQESVP